MREPEKPWRADSDAYPLGMTAEQHHVECLRRHSAASEQTDVYAQLRAQAWAELAERWGQKWWKAAA